jgi:hypothetical protein
MGGKEGIDKLAPFNVNFNCQHELSLAKNRFVRPRSAIDCFFTLRWPSYRMSDPCLFQF